MNSESLNSGNLSGFSPQSTLENAAESRHGESGLPFQADGGPVASNAVPADPGRSEQEQIKAGETGTPHCEVYSPQARNPQNPTIPEHFTESVAEAADFYHSIGLAIHPCNRHDQGRPGEQGKKPCSKRWMEITADDYTPAMRRENFEGSRPQNIGCVVRGPFVIVDLDSKLDRGVSVAEWLETQPALGNVPRERTGGGAHLWFCCHDLPKFADYRGNLLSKNLSAPISDTVTAELIYATNVILSPSRHPSGAFYSWEVTGEIPEISWADLQKIFGFSAPCIPKEPKKGKEKPWWAVYKGDLRTLDILSLTREAGLYGALLNADIGSHSASCPWASEHSDAGKGWTSQDTATAIFEREPGKTPGFKCLHSHCSERTLEHFLVMAEARCPGIVDRHCKSMRIWSPGQRSILGNRRRILLPQIGRTESEFSAEVGECLGEKEAWFCYDDSIVIVLESKATNPSTGQIRLHRIQSTEALTEIERHVDVGVLCADGAGDPVFKKKSMTEAQARILVAAFQFSERLPVLRRVLDIPMPIIFEGKILYPKPRFDSRFGTYLGENAPPLFEMSLEEARNYILTELLGDAQSGGFCWRDEQAKCHAIARVLTPFCRGLMGWAHAPLWIIEANRERCGKDFFAGAVSLLFLGRQAFSAPFPKDSDVELRKVITSELLKGAKMIHYTNIKGHVCSGILEAATDNTGVWGDRLLGGNDFIYLRNEAEFSISTNSATWTPDIEGRARRIALNFLDEDIQQRAFRHRDLHAWVLSNRSQLLSALAAFVREWDSLGRPEGRTPFSSFPEWSRIVGGIMCACGLGDPCLPHVDASNTNGDQTTESLKLLWQLAYGHFGNEFIQKNDLVEFIIENQGDGLFEWMDLGSRGGLTVLGKLLKQHAGRGFGGIRLEIPPAGKNNRKYRFVKDGGGPEGSSGGSGTCTPETCRAKTDDEQKMIECGENTSGMLDAPPEVHEDPVFVTDARDFAVIAQEIAAADASIALDIETYTKGGRCGALSPFLPGAEIRLLTIAMSGRAVWIIDLQKTGYDLRELGDALEKTTVVGHNLPFDLLWLYQKCNILPRSLYCTMTASRLLTAGSLDQKNDLGAVVHRHLDIRLKKGLATSDWESPALNDEQVRYCIEDVFHLHALRAKLGAEITKAGLDCVSNLEMNLIPAVVKMEAAGFPVNREVFETVKADALEMKALLAEELRKLVGNPDFSPASPKQVVGALNSLGLSVANSSEETLCEIDHEVARLLLEYRSVEAISKTAQTLLESVSDDERIHARFTATGTRTGRFSCKEPNLQNVTRGEMRSAFCAPEGYSMVVADYSQIELRAIADIAGDQLMQEAFKNGEDLHRKTAAIILKKPVDEVTSQERQTAKAVNFGLINGMGEKGLVKYAAKSYGVKMSLKDAQMMKMRFLKAYHGIKAYHDQASVKAAGGIGPDAFCARTLTNRRNLLPRSAEDRWKRFTAFVNTPVQGSCGDGIKEAMVRIDALLPASTRIVATIHDELVILAPAEVAEAVKEMVEEQMIAAMSVLFPHVPIVVDAKVCSTWGEK